MNTTKISLNLVMPAILSAKLTKRQDNAKIMTTELRLIECILNKIPDDVYMFCLKKKKSLSTANCNFSTISRIVIEKMKPNCSELYIIRRRSQAHKLQEGRQQ